MARMSKKQSANERAALRPEAVVLLGVSGGIAAYKAADLVSRLKKEGCDVHVVMTDSATHFVAPLTFEAISGNRVFTSVFPAAGVDHPEQAYPHLYPATRADVFVVAPATADIIARLAHGLGGDALTASALSLPDSCRRYFAPAMNVEMWHQPVVQQNVAALEKLGWIRIGPEAGSLACGMVGEGRMSEPADISRHVLQGGDRLATNRSLAGRKVLVLSGPTCEYLDPVRFISNASSGKMGKALAESAISMGAKVVFVTGPVAEANLPGGEGVDIRKVVSAEEMLEAGRKHYRESDVIVYAAAVADYRPATHNAEKMPKSKEGLALKLKATPDVAATLNRSKRPGQVAIGFALQTHDGEKRALEKMKAKKFDGIVLNHPDALGGNEGTYAFFEREEGVPQAWGRLAKAQCAGKIMAFAAGKVSSRE